MNPYVKFSIQRGPFALDESTLLPAWVSRWGGEYVEGENWPSPPPPPPPLTCSGIFLMHWVTVAERWAKFKVASLDLTYNIISEGRPFFFPIKSDSRMYTGARGKQSFCFSTFYLSSSVSLHGSFPLNKSYEILSHTSSSGFMRKLLHAKGNVWFVYKTPVWKIKRVTVFLSVYATVFQLEQYRVSFIGFSPERISVGNESEWRWTGRTRTWTPGSQTVSSRWPGHRAASRPPTHPSSMDRKQIRQITSGNLYMDDRWHATSRYALYFGFTRLDLTVTVNALIICGCVLYSLMLIQKWMERHYANGLLLETSALSVLFSEMAWK